MTPPSPHPIKEVTVDSIYRGRGGRSKVKQLSERARLGWRIFLSVLLLALALVVALVVLALASYPYSENFRDADGVMTEAQLQVWIDARAEWLRQVTNMGQVFLFTSIVPLLGTIAGYLLGERSGRRAKDKSAD